MTPQQPAQLGVCSWSLQPKTSLELADRVAATGLSLVQLHLNPLINDPASWDLRPLLDVGIAFASGMYGAKDEDYSTIARIRVTGGFVPDATWDANWAMLEHIAPKAQELGLTMVSSHAGFLPHDPKSAAMEKIVDRIARIAGLFREHGLTLLLETGQETAETFAAFFDLLDARGATNTAINFDPANMILYDMGNPIAALRKLMPRVRQLHMKDATHSGTPGAWGEEVPIREGEVDWEETLATLAESDFGGGLIIEREQGNDRVGDVKRGAERLRALMEARR